MRQAYESGLTLQEVGDMHGVSKQRVRQVLFKRFGIRGGFHRSAKVKEDENSVESGIVQMRIEGFSRKDIVCEIGRSNRFVFNVLRKHNLEKPSRRLKIDHAGVVRYRCSYCKLWLEYTEFKKYKSQSAASSLCTQCCKDRAYMWQTKNRDRFIEYQRKYQLAKRTANSARSSPRQDGVVGP